MTRRKTDAEFRAEVKALVGDEYAILSKYKASRIKVKFVHRSCGYMFEMLPTNFLQGSRCPKCMKIKSHKFQKKSTTTLIAQIKEAVGQEYILASNYKSCRKKIALLHVKCGFLYWVLPSNFIKRGNRCPYCGSHKGQKVSDREFRIRVKELGQGQYEPLSKYRKANSKILMLHKVCGKSYHVLPNNFFRGSRCPFCQKQKEIMPFAKIALKVKQMTNGEYKILPQEYKNTHQKALFYHCNCKNIFKMKPNSFFYGQRCPFCRSSRGEKIVENYLQNRGITYKRQFKINSCRDQRALPFDFAIFNSDQSINCLIEYQGEQHFYDPFAPSSFKGKIFSTESVIATQKHDAMKLQYCKDHGIKLIRINHPQTSSKSNSIEFIERLVNRTLNKELKVS